MNVVDFYSRGLKDPLWLLMVDFLKTIDGDIGPKNLERFASDSITVFPIRQANLLFLSN